MVASNWASNMDVFSNFDIPQFTQRGVSAAAPATASAAAPAAAPAVHTACFLMSDGDNVQWILDGFATNPSWFGSPDRGCVC